MREGTPARPAPLRPSRRGSRGAGLAFLPLHSSQAGATAPPRPTPGPARSICVVSFCIKIGQVFQGTFERGRNFIDVSVGFLVVGAV